MVLTVSLAISYLSNQRPLPAAGGARQRSGARRKLQVQEARGQETREGQRQAASAMGHPAFGVRFGSLGKQSGRGVRFGSLASLQGSENDVRHGRPSVAWCFAVARPRFWRLEGCHLGLLSVQKATLHSMGSRHQTL